MIKKLLTILFIASGSLLTQAQPGGYELNIGIKNLANRDVILGHHFAGKLFADDTLRLDQSGRGVLKGNTSYPEGMYFFLMPSHAKFDFFMTGNQHFAIETDTLDLFENLKFTNSPENQAILEYQKSLLSKQKEANELQEKKKQLTDEKQIKEVETELGKLAAAFKTETSKLIANQKDNFVGTFVKSTQEVDIPEPPRNDKGVILDSLFQLRYYRTHYFDNFDISDARLLRTPIYEEKLKTYLEKVLLQTPDSINPACDRLLSKAEKDPVVFRYMLVTLFNEYATSKIMGFDAVYAHIAEDWYIPKATFSDTAFIRNTRENVERIKPVLVGKKVADLHMLWVPTEQFIEAKADSAIGKNPHLGTFVDLYNLKARVTILAFWESDCGHCKKLIPELYKVYEKFKSKGVEVLAVHMLGGIEGKEKWIKFVNENELYDWMNVWNPYDFSYKKFFDVRTTPTIYVLDKDKKIIAKKLEPEQIEDFLNTMLAREDKKQKTPATP
jgi:thiol-disulfide isomerase/thioredoxin